LKVRKNKEKPQIKVFCDFDGTIAYDDVGNEFFKEYGKFEPYYTELVNGKINIKEYYYATCKSLKIDLNEEESLQFIRTRQIDPNFKKFYEYCRQNDYQFFIISDGFDFYIRPILELYGINEVEIFCNTIVKGNDGSFLPVFPLASESCNCSCASCKRNAMLNRIDENSLSVFVGDGMSDYCVAEHSDIIFAKKELAAYCNLKKIPHYPYSNFFDIYRLFNSLITKNKINKRYQAELLRKKAFETE